LYALSDQWYSVDGYSPGTREPLTKRRGEFGNRLDFISVNILTVSAFKLGN